MTRNVGGGMSAVKIDIDRTIIQIEITLTQRFMIDNKIYGWYRDAWLTKGFMVGINTELYD